MLLYQHNSQLQTSTQLQHKSHKSTRTYNTRKQ